MIAWNEFCLTPQTAEYEQLFTAVQNNDLLMVEEILKGSTLNTNLPPARCPRSDVALLFAAVHGNLELVNLLLSRGVNVNCHGCDRFDRFDPYDPSPLHFAARYDQFIVMQTLLDHGADVNDDGGKYGVMPVCEVLRGVEVVESKHRHAIKTLLDAGTDLHAGTLSCGELLLTQAAGKGDLELVQYIYSLCVVADMPSLPRRKRKAFCAAVKRGSIEVVNFFMEQGCSVTTVEIEAANTIPMLEHLRSYVADDEVLKASAILHKACRCSQADLVSHLLQAKLDVNGRDSYGDTPLLTVMDSPTESLDLIQMLITHGADVTAQSTGGVSGEHRRGDTACKSSLHGRPGVVSLLIAALPSTTIDMRNRVGQTALHHFTFCFNYLVVTEPSYLDNRALRLDTLNMLLRAGADPNAEDVDGRTPLRNIALSTSYDTSRNHQISGLCALLQAGARIDAETRDMLLSNPPGSWVDQIIDTQGNSLRRIFEDRGDA